MKKYAKIVNEETRACEVGLGTNTDFYKSIGMVEMEVEQAYDSQWYLQGYAPSKPQSLINQEKINELKSKLVETDYVVVKIAEGSATKEEYADVIAQRQAWRDEINELQSIETNVSGVANYSE